MAYRKKYLLILTGGTADSEPYEFPDNPPPNAEPLAYSLVAKQFHELMQAEGLIEGKDYDILYWRSKDSKDFSKQEIRDLADIIATAQHENILVVHGTDRTVQNSKRMARALRHTITGGADKRVIFTGAMIPIANDPENIMTSPGKLANLPPSDHPVVREWRQRVKTGWNERVHWNGYAKSEGMVNIANAIDHFDKGLSPGVYIGFHGLPLDPFDTVKNFKTKHFESTSAHHAAI